MAQSIIWGYPFTSQGSLYGGVAPYIAESNATNDGTNPGYGVRLAARKYDNDASTVFATSGAADVLAHNRGSRLLVSVSNPSLSGFTYAQATNGSSIQTTNDAHWNALFNRIKPTAAGGLGYLNYSQAVSGGGLASYGGFTWGKFELCIQHEVDNPQPSHQKWGTAAQYQTYVRHIHNLAVAAGVRQYFDLNLCIMQFGIDQNRVDQYITGITDIVDILGIDYYQDFDTVHGWIYDGATTSFSVGFASSIAWVRKYNKPFNIPELSVAEPILNGSKVSGSDTTMQNWFTGMASYLNGLSDVQCVGAYLWSQPSSAYQNSNKLSSEDPATSTAHLGKHNGILSAIGSTGNQPNPTGGTPQTVPSAPTNMHVISFSSDGTQATIGWDAAPAWTPSVTNMRFYQATGISGGPPNVGGDLTVANTRTIAGLIPGGQSYTVSATWKNSIGNSGYGLTSGGALLTFQTPTVASGSSQPTINTATATQNPADSREVILAATATDPNNRALTYTWTLMSPTGVIVTLTGSNVTSAELAEIGNWTYALSVRNSNGDFNTQSGNFPITNPGDTAHTRYSQYLKPQTNITSARDLGPILRPFMDDVDFRIYTNTFQKSSWNAYRGLLGSSFDAEMTNSATVQALTSGWAYWSAVQLEDDHFGSIWFNLSVVQIGTGTQIAVYDNTLSILPNGVYTNTLVGGDGRTVDQALQNTAFSGAVGGARYVLPQPEIGRTPGEWLYVQVYNTAASTPPSLRISTAPSTCAKLGPLGMQNPAFGGYNLGVSQTLPQVLAVGSYTAQSQIWVGLGEVTD